MIPIFPMIGTRGRAAAVGMIGGLLLSAQSLAAGDPLAADLCPLLDTLAPQVAGYAPEGAQAQLVMAIAEKYDADPEKLREVRAGIDEATLAGCPEARAALLETLEMGSLAEAL